MHIRRIDRKDRSIVKDWLDKLNWGGFDVSFMPKNSYMVMDGDICVCSSYYYVASDSPIAFIGITVSNPDYKEDKTDYINSLIKYMLEEMKNKGLRACYYSTDALSEKFIKKYMEPLGFRFSPGFVGACPLTEKDDVDFLI